MRLTFHNGKTHKNGKIYSTKHNDRNFDVNNAKHIKNDKVLYVLPHGKGKK